MSSLTVGLRRLEVVAATSSRQRRSLASSEWVTRHSGRRYLRSWQADVDRLFVMRSQARPMALTTFSLCSSCHPTHPMPECQWFVSRDVMQGQRTQPEAPFRHASGSQATSLFAFCRIQQLQKTPLKAYPLAGLRDGGKQEGRRSPIDVRYPEGAAVREKAFSARG